MGLWEVAETKNVYPFLEFCPLSEHGDTVGDNIGRGSWRRISPCVMLTLRECFCTRMEKLFTYNRVDKCQTEEILLSPFVVL